MRLFLLCALAFSHVASAQVRIDPLGLSGKRVYDLALWGERIYVATDDGVFVRWSQQNPDTAWTPCGHSGLRVRAIYPHQSGALGYALTAGIERRPGEEDSVVIYCSENSDSAWVPADEGIDRSQVRMVSSIDGFPSPEICGETYAATEGLVFRRQIGRPWEQVFDMGIVTTNVVRANMANASVWVGGETTIMAPFISRSDDKGETWTTAYPDLQGDNACDALAFDPADTSVVYAGMVANTL